MVLRKGAMALQQNPVMQRDFIATGRGITGGFLLRAGAGFSNSVDICRHAGWVGHTPGFGVGILGQRIRPKFPFCPIPSQISAFVSYEIDRREQKIRIPAPFCPILSHWVCRLVDRAAGVAGEMYVGENAQDSW